MKTLEFRDGLVENTFANGNSYSYDKSYFKSTKLYFNTDSPFYPFVLKSGISDKNWLQYSDYGYQLRNRTLSIKKVDEILNGAKVPIRCTIKRRIYLIGKGFLSTYVHNQPIIPLFIACVDGSKSQISMEDVRFFVSRDLYTDEYKIFHSPIKKLIGEHPGDVIVCRNILDYISEKIYLPKGGTLLSLNKHKHAVARAALVTAFY